MPKGWKVVSPKGGEPSLLSLSAREMAHLVATAEVSALELVDWHVERIEGVNPVLNAVVVPLFEEARRQAAAADGARAHGDPLGPLHGVPITVKESFDVAGTPTTAGVSGHAEQLASEDCPLVRRLRHAGAIVLGKTNVAQLLLYQETDNPLYGRTNNPWDPDRSPGGSSGGEAAIIAAGGSPLGLGSDIGGSVRVPAHFCGIHALKPTSNRLTRRGSFDGRMFPGETAIVGQAGPLARSVEDLALVMRVLDEGEPGDPWEHSVPLGDPERVELGGLRVGMFSSDGLFPPSPGVRRAVEKAAGVLGDRGASVTELSSPDPEEAFALYYGILSAGGVGWMKEWVRESPVDRRVRALILLARLPRPARAAAVAVARTLGQAGLALVTRSMGRRSTEGYWGLVERWERYRARFLGAMAAHRMDALICPPHSLPALTHGATYDLGTAGTYATLFNLLGMPAGVVSVTRVRPGEESDRPAAKDRAFSAARKVEAGSSGLPVGVQVAARHWREDLVLALMAALEEEFRVKPDYPAVSAPFGANDGEVRR
ncbi:MAG: amidase [Actinomycetota bacterium]